MTMVSESVTSQMGSSSGMLVACMSRVMLDFSLSLACSSVCSTTPILTSIWTISCLSFVKLCRIFTTGAADEHTQGQ